MAGELTLADQIQQYNDCLILYKGKPHKVKQIAGEIKLLDLLTQRTKLVTFKLADFTAPFMRLGFVNLDETAIYVARKPARMYLVGVNRNNSTAAFCAGASSPGDVLGIQHKALDFDTVEHANMLLGHYPKLGDAIKRAETFGGCVAFDKQFAVDSRHLVFYKGKKCGEVVRGKVVFNKDLEYLSILLDGNYEKATRTFGKKAA